MKRLLMVALFLAAPYAGAQGQTATEAQTNLLTEIAKCLTAGLPEDWQQAEMLVRLKAPGAESGDASYLVRRSLSGGQFEPFRPCDARKPARQLVVDLRKLQEASRRGWTGARFVIHREGKFDLTFDYPK